MPKILSQAGVSLADTYNVQGSIAGVENLESAEVTLVHEMGATIGSERMSGLIRRSTTGAIAQTITFSDILTLPVGFVRLLGVQVITDATARLSRVSVHQRSSPAGVDQEIPIWVWDGSNSQSVDIEDAGVVGIDSLLTPAPETLVPMPSLLIGRQQDANVGQIAFRGLTATFGAGTVVITLLLYMAFIEEGNLPSKGLPMPSW